MFPSARKNPGLSPYSRSVFKRMTMYYLSISLATILIFCAVWYHSTSEWLTNQKLDYNRQQLEALYKATAQQHAALKQSQRRLYTYSINENELLYSVLSDYLYTVRHCADQQPFTYQEKKLILNHYLNTVERLSESSLTLFMYCGLDYHREDIYYAKTYDKFNPGTITRLAAEKVMDSNAAPSRSSTYTIPTFHAYGENGDMYLYILYDAIRSYESAARSEGYIINVYSTGVFEELLNSFRDPFAGKVSVLDSCGSVLFDSENSAYGKPYANFDAVSEAKNSIFTDGRTRTTVLYNNLYGYYVIGKLTIDSAFSLNSESYLHIFQVALIVVVFASLFSVLVVRSFSKRISALLGTIFQARSDIKTRAPISGRSDEIDAVSDGLNNMLSRIETHIHQAYEMEIEQQSATLRQREAELFALQSQINPHFLYNTLEIIRMKALANGDTDTAMMIQSLARLFRERAKGSGVVLLKQEIGFCHQVMEIYGIRHDCAISLHVKIDSALLSCAVLRDSLTPLLENVLVHGVDPSMDPETLEVAITGWTESEDLLLEVRDNGAGITAEKLFQLHAALGRPVLRNNTPVGLINIHNRLRMVYGEGYGVSITSGADGTAVRLKMHPCTFEALSELVSQNL